MASKRFVIRRDLNGNSSCFAELSVLSSLLSLARALFTFNVARVLFNKLTSVFLCVCPVIDHEFRHNIVKVAVDSRGDSRVDPQTTLTML